MAKEKLNPKTLASLKPKRREDGEMIAVEYNDGGGLYLVATGAGTHHWIFKYRWPDANGVKKGKRMGLGALEDVTIEQARELAREADKKLKRDGINPMVERPGGRSNNRQSSPTFLAFVEYIRRKATSHLGEEGVYQWDRCMNVFAKSLHDKRMETITRHDIVECLEPIWMEIQVTAKKCQAMLADLFDRAVAADKYPETARNPADWKLIKKIMERQTHKEKSHRSLAYKQVPAVWPRLVELDTMAAWTAQFIILTGVRTKEALQATKDQFNLDHEDGARWDIPGVVMKNGSPANVPLSREAVAVLRKVLAWHGQLHVKSQILFCGLDGERQGQNTVLFMLQNQLKLDTTTHGFRSSFRSWGGDQAGFERETLEHCLHHLLGDEAEMAYNKADQWVKRQQIFQAWADFVTGPTPTPLRRRPDLKVVAA